MMIKCVFIPEGGQILAGEKVEGYCNIECTEFCDKDKVHFWFEEDIRALKVIDW